MFTVVTRWLVNNRYDKGFRDFTEQDAIDKLALVVESFPFAFYTVQPQGGPRDWLVDPVAKTLSYDPVPLPPPTLDPDDELDDAIEAATTFQELKTALLGRASGRRG